MQFYLCYLAFILYATPSCLGASTTATGRVTCFGEPMPYVLINMKDKDIKYDDWMGSGRTKADGTFSVYGSADDIFYTDPDPFLIIKLQYSSQYGRMTVQGSDWTSRVRSYSRYLNFGPIDLRSIQCKAYLQFSKAMKRFRERAGMNIPVSTLNVRTGVNLPSGTAFSATDGVDLPNGFKTFSVTKQLAEHELAHIARHSLDGNRGHFDRDIKKYGYKRSHACGTKSNEGYAFNEGWAQYWANSCHGRYGLRANDLQYEGNVANALRQLKKKCRSSDAKFVNLLKAYPGLIHTFRQFNDRHFTKYYCKLVKV